MLGACKGLPEFEAAGPSSAFLNRKEVAVQHRGVTAGTEVHRCLGAVGRLQREREFSVLDLETLYPLGTSPFSVVGGPAE